jgi:Flp pilus assembly protein TadB
MIGYDKREKAKEGAAMTLVDIVVILVIAGLLMWLINTYIPMAAAIKSLLNILVFVVLLIWVLQSLGIIGEVAGIRIPPLK